MQLHSKIHQTILNHGLLPEFSTTVSDFYTPLASHLYHDMSQLAQSSKTSKPQFIGIQGSQGSGKSTCADFLKVILETEYDLKVLVVSIDDFYLTLAERQHLAQTVHPLLITRGVPGTHDVNMMQTMFDHALQQQRFKVPVFNKAKDDRADESQWQKNDSPLDVIILEGWCVGIPAQASDKLDEPLNALEHDEDPAGEWRQLVNQKLARDYQHLFSRLDHLVTLQVPSFNCVYEWRLLQEKKMIDRLTQLGHDTSKAQSPEQLKRFIAHYQRLTEHACDIMPDIAHYVLWIDKQHHITRLTSNRS